ncbi:MAG: T9SS type A sorting domain-containing protein [bacterium]
MILFSYGYSLAQSSTFTYGYDDAGNRVIREIGPSQFHPNEPDEKEVYNDYLAGHGINIFPNPSRGKIEIVISNLKDKEQARIEIFDLLGEKVFELNNLKVSNTIDISDKPGGAYIMKIFINEKSIVWKVMKE